MVSAEKILSELQTRILTRVWTPGQEIPSGNKLAEEFGVSPSTIKKALHQLTKEGLVWGRRGKGRFVADNLLPRKTWTIGVVLYDMDHLHHPLHSSRIAGIQDALRDTPYHLVLFAFSSNHDRRVEAGAGYRWLGLLDPRALDGVIVLSRQVKAVEIEELARYVPVCTDRPQLAELGACVRDDFASGSFEAARYLLELGHRCLALATVGESDHIGFAQREGFRLAVQTAGRDGACVRVAACGAFSVDEGRRVGRELLASTPRPTAILAGSHELVLGIYREVTAAGLEVPADISLVGWNDTLETEVGFPMTTLKLRAFEAGRKYVEQLLSLIDHPGAKLPVVTVPVDLVIRNSTRPPVPG